MFRALVDGRYMRLLGMNKRWKMAEREVEIEGLKRAI